MQLVLRRGQTKKIWDALLAACVWKGQKQVNKILPKYHLIFENSVGLFSDLDHTDALLWRHLKFYRLWQRPLQ